MKGLVTRYLHVKYQSPTPYSSRDIAQVKVLSTDADDADDDDDDDADDDNDAEGMALALRTFSSRRAKKYFYHEQIHKQSVLEEVEHNSRQ